MKNSEPAGLTEVPISKDVVLKLLSHIPGDLILVGGQALAFWVEHYSIDATSPSGEDEAYVSLDADFLGKRAHVKVLADIRADSYNFWRQFLFACLGNTSFGGVQNGWIEDQIAIAVPKRSVFRYSLRN